MPRVEMHSFRPGGSGGSIGKYYKWVNDPAEDSDFVSYMQDYWEGRSGFFSDFSVDRSGASPELRYQEYEVIYSPNPNPGAYPTGNWRSEPLHVGDYMTPEDWRNHPIEEGSSIGLPAAQDVTGWWECDEYGRPYDLNDLLAVAGPPKVGGLTGSVSSARALTLQWQADAAYVAYEVHEFLKVPSSTLKATVTESQRVSGSLERNQTLEYAVRGKTADDELGPLSDTVIVTITDDGGTVEPGGQAP